MGRFSKCRPPLGWESKVLGQGWDPMLFGTVGDIKSVAIPLFFYHPSGAQITAGIRPEPVRPEAAPPLGRTVGSDAHLGR